ncbi:MAG TPA: ligase-associated DNA damage response DEXH box helicase [Bacteroidia bacterium]|jgi:ATP-dependent Lhr-like helicase
MKAAKQWFDQQQWKPHAFQRETWKSIAAGNSGLLNAPTGYGKTFAIWFGVLQHYLDQKKKPAGLHCLWITPLRALSKEILNAAKQVSQDLELTYTVGLRTGDTPLAERAKQKKRMPQGLITTPESVHLLLAQKGYPELFRNLQFVVVDEWHELLGSKRGVQIELALSRLKAINPHLKVWGISATIGNMEEAKEILLGSEHEKGVMIRADIKKKIVIETVLPDTLEKFPWAGHLGLKLVDKVLPIIHANNSTLLFTNTRFQAETWYRHLLETDPSLAGVLALHHGSLGEETRQWVENALHDGKLKAVVCTSSLDLGVDFRPVDTVIQVGSPKGIARFMQRAGRSGHQPGATSRIYFVPTHSLEIIEGSAMRYAITNNRMESRIPFVRSFDVLVQYLVTLAVSEGFEPQQIYGEIIETHCYNSVTEDEFNWCLQFITKGGKSLYAYDEFHKVIIENGIYKVTNRRTAMQHRLSMGTIVSSTMLTVKFVSGKYLGSIEEWFLSRLKPGDVFWFAGRNLELVRVKDMTAQVRPSKSKNGVIPSWEGGKMPLSSQLAAMIRERLNEYYEGTATDRELKFLAPLLEEQKKRSLLPHENELLIEKIKTREGCHVFVYPFEGRYVHEGMAAIMANRIAMFRPITFSIAMNDYGFELLSDQDIPIEEAIDSDLFSSRHLVDDVRKSMNTTEMARRRFRDIAAIAGLVFTGFPGKQIKTKHLQASSKLFFSVFEDYEKDNLLLKECYDELYDFQLEIARLRKAFERIERQKIVLQYPERFSPFSFPIFTERWRGKFTNEDIEARVMKIKAQMRKD